MLLLFIYYCYCGFWSSSLVFILCVFYYEFLRFLYTFYSCFYYFSYFFTYFFGFFYGFAYYYDDYYDDYYEEVSAFLPPFFAVIFLLFLLSYFFNFVATSSSSLCSECKGRSEESSDEAYLAIIDGFLFFTILTGSSSFPIYSNLLGG